MKTSIPGCTSGLLFALLAGVVGSNAHAGAINSNPYTFSVQDPCAYGSHETNVPACTAALADRYKKRCVASWTAPRERCGPGECNDWLMTARTQAIVVDTPTLACKKQLVFTKKLLTTAGTFATDSWCLSGTADAKLRQYAVPAGTKTYPVAVEKLSTAAHGTRIFVRAINNVTKAPFENWIYHLSLQETLCSWKKYCDPTTRTIKSGVDFSAEIPTATDAWSAGNPTPIGSLCKFDSTWMKANAAISCVLQQAGSIDNLCATVDPLKTTVTKGIP
ncbi:MAG: hypothetical protein RI953_2470 [Pseudomonadota bacterium]|jgi:hypothetical protein